MFYNSKQINFEIFSTKLQIWLTKKPTFCFYNSNISSSEYDFIAAVDVQEEFECNYNCFSTLEQFYKSTPNSWWFGFLSYDLKNELEELHSSKQDGLNFALMCFFKPKYLLLCKNQILTIHSFQEKNLIGIDQIFKEIEETKITKNKEIQSFQINSRIDKQDYINRVKEIKNHILKGDIYEMNFCQEFYAENAVINPLEVYLKLNEKSSAPFSAFCRFKDKYIISSSPERYLKKQGSSLVSQPIKGTFKRGLNKEEDDLFIKKLREDEKERAENIMIVDLVRNDLSKIAVKGSVKVKELCEIYSFKQVHQMISTITAELDPKYNFIDSIKATFPMGSMTGAPKVKAMELIEKYESAKRGVYSGALGYITPEGDFDFNVVIRTVLYNESEKYLSFTTGSAITAKSDPEKEYEECMLKAKAMMEIFEII